MSYFEQLEDEITALEFEIMHLERHNILSLAIWKSFVWPTPITLRLADDFKNESPSHTGCCEVR